uniref:Uncharacterized protein n=1 Tax=Tanacetum cinerariifolium TaxID=118510 RepID=A0A699I082_TANCI|nr:hypothetical protein [Tanacetum cinerariifolium]
MRHFFHLSTNFSTRAGVAAVEDSEPTKEDDAAVEDSERTEENDAFFFKNEKCCCIYRRRESGPPQAYVLMGPIESSAAYYLHSKAKVRVLHTARGLGFKPRRGGFPSGAKKEWGLSPKTKVRVLHTAQLDVTVALELRYMSPKPNHLSQLRWPPRVTLGRLLPHARGLGFKARRGGFPSEAKKEWGLSLKA